RVSPTVWRPWRGKRARRAPPRPPPPDPAGDKRPDVAPYLPDLPAFCWRNLISVFRSFGLIAWPNVGGMTVGGQPGVIFAFGSVIDCLISAALIPARTLSRSGPV